MADNHLLRIRKGEFSRLPVNKVAGTIYVTTDEKAMYVDISATERIRLGQIIEVKNLTEWQNLKPPYSQEGFYYIVDDNALIKYTGNGTTHSWQQINAPTDLSDLKTGISNLEGAVGSKTDTSEKDTAFGRIKKNAEDIATNASDIDGLDTRLTTAEGEIDTLQSEMDAVEKKADDNETNIGTLQTGVNDLNTLVGAKSDASTADTAFGRIKKNTENIATNTNNITKLKTDLGTNDKTDGSTAFTRIAALEGSVATNSGNITTNANAIKTLQSSDSAQNTSIENLNTTVYGSANGQTNTDEGLVNKVAALREDLGNKSDDNTGSGTAFARIADLRSKIATNTTKIGENATAISENATAISGLGTRLTTAETGITGLKDRLDLAEPKITTLQEDVGDLEDSVNALDTAINGNTGILKTIGSSGDAASASGSLYARIAYNKSQIESNDSDIANIGKLIGQSTDSDSDTLYGLINSKVDKTTYATDKAALEKKIDDEILSANAMKYISTTSKVPTGTFSIGDTYVASVKIFNVPTDASGATTTTAYPGDLLIANGTEDPASGTINSATLYWDVVDTGYNASHEDKLTGADNAIQLTSYADAPLGSVAFESKVVNGNTSALTVTVANDKVTLAVEWEDF